MKMRTKILLSIFVILLAGACASFIGYYILKAVYKHNTETLWKENLE